MADGKTVEDIQWIEKRLRDIGKAVRALQDASSDYLRWMSSRGYAKATRASQRCELKAFAKFVEQRRLVWDGIFTMGTLEALRKPEGQAMHMLSEDYLGICLSIIGLGAPWRIYDHGCHKNTKIIFYARAA
jgi:hypothetical protein